MKHTKRRATRSKTQQKTLTPLRAQTENQKKYIESIINNHVIFCSGPSGSGKSFIASGMASHSLHKGEVEKIIISRPLICTGKDIGSLPGELSDKIAPYLLPMQENLKYFLTQVFYGHYFNNDQIQYKPLEVMRGATFHNSIMILDEAQNCTLEQIKMFITRMGENSKVIINGDIKQTDIKNKSGLEIVIEKLKHINGVQACHLTYDDIQRNGILGEVLKALED